MSARSGHPAITQSCAMPALAARVVSRLRFRRVRSAPTPRPAYSGQADTQQRQRFRHRGRSGSIQVEADIGIATRYVVVAQVVGVDRVERGGVGPGIVDKVAGDRPTGRYVRKLMVTVPRAGGRPIARNRDADGEGAAD